MTLKLSYPPDVLADLKRSGLDGKVAHQLGIHVPELKGFGGVMRYRIPYFDLDGRRIDFHRDRFVSNPLPKGSKGKPQRYMQEAKAPRLYFPPIGGTDWAKVARDPSLELIITEGEKKAAAACKAGFPTVGIGGVDNWHSKKGPPIPDLDLIKWKGRRVRVVFDSDYATNERVREAARQFEGELANRRARVSIVRIPQGPNGEKWGLDDLLVAWQGPKKLRELLDASKADARKADTSEEGLTFAALMEKDFPPPRWVAQNLIPAGFTILAGKRKVGKSFWVIQLALAVVEGGRAFGEYDCEPGEVLVLALEDPEVRVKNRLKKMLKGREPSKQATVFCQGQWPRADQGGLDKLRDWLRDHPKARLVIIDTLAKIRERRRGGRNDPYAEDYQAVGELKAIADEFNIGMVVLHHLRKMPSEDPFDEISGTTGLTGAADTLLILKRPNKEEQGTLMMTGRDIAERELAIRFNKDGDRTWTVLGNADDFRLSPARKEILRTLKEIGRPASPAEVAERLGKPRDAIKHTMHRMRWDGSLREVGGGKYELGADSTPSLVTKNDDDVSPLSPVPAVPGLGTWGLRGPGTQPPSKLHYKPKPKFRVFSKSA